MTIKKKFLLTVLVIFTTVGVVGWMTGVGIKAKQREQVTRSLETIANVEVARITDRLAAMSHATAGTSAGGTLATEVAATVGLESNERKDRVEMLLAQLIGDLGGMRAGYVLASDGATVLADTSDLGSDWLPRRMQDSEVATAVEFIRRGAPHASGPAFRVTPDDERFVHVMPLTAEGSTVGYLVAECDMAPIRQLVSEYTTLGQTSEAHLVQRTEKGAQVITDLRFKDDSRFDTIVPAANERAPAIIAITEPGRTLDGLTDYRNKRVVASLHRVPGTQWSLVIKVDESEAYGSLARALKIGLIGFSIAGTLSLLLILISFGSLIRRIRKMSESATAIKSGQFEARVGDRSKDELGALARAFDDMTDTLVADMNRRREVEQELEHSAGHDLLTGLPNRQTFQKELKRALLQETTRGTVAVFFCDLDDFKTVNDDLGHSAGDSLLRDVAQRLNQAVGPQHILARFGGDEFVVVARGLSSGEEAFSLAERMRESLANPISLVGRDVFVTTSVGVAISRSGSTAETLVRDADAAMYQAKDVGRHRVVLYNESIGARANNRLSETTELRRAIAHGGLTTAAQPIVDLDTGAVYAYEVLVRWSHGGKEVDPSEFVTRATELDLAGALDRWVLDEACRSMRRLQGTTLAEHGWLHVNVTGTSLVDVTFADDVLRVLAAHHLPPSALCFEIVEDRLSGANQDALETLARLRLHGVRVAIDDFGTGHSSLARLRDLPADTVKIDQAFIRDLDTDRASRAITSAIISLARELGLEVVAEGIEARSQQATLLQIGCRLGQGYLLGPPRAVADVVATALVH